MREVVFVVADAIMQQTLQGFFGRPYRTVLAAAGHWPNDQPKPPRPKEALEYMRRVYRTDLSPAVLRAAEQVSVRGCHDPAFRLLSETPRRWFPAEGR